MFTLTKLQHNPLPKHHQIPFINLHLNFRWLINNPRLTVSFNLLQFISNLHLLIPSHFRFHNSLSKLLCIVSNKGEEIKECIEFTTFTDKTYEVYGYVAEVFIIKVLERETGGDCCAD